jgi:hypothetical protein
MSFEQLAEPLRRVFAHALTLAAARKIVGAFGGPLSAALDEIRCAAERAAKRPLYGLQGLSERLFVPVVVCEGEKAADAATRLLPGFAAVTSPNGSKSAGKADWSPLKGRAVTIWPDADSAGLEYARHVAKLASSSMCSEVEGFQIEA